MVSPLCSITKKVGYMTNFFGNKWGLSLIEGNARLGFLFGGLDDFVRADRGKCSA